MAITSNSPYYDDFDDSKGYQRILFKPGYAVQARELIQLQTAISDQIAKFGRHIFKQGSVVIPGNSFADLNVPYIKLQTTTADLSVLEGLTITGTSGITAIIRKAVPAAGAEPAVLYLGYNRGGNAGETIFADVEVLTVASPALTFTAAATASSGVGSMAFVNTGVYFVNGVFAYVPKHSVVIDAYTSTPSAHVLLKISETIVDSDQDGTLLDPAQGSYNYAAPGADRLKVALTLETLPLGSTITDDYVEIMRYNVGVLEEHSRYPKYNELEKSLARRTYDESGDYVVSGLELSTREHLRSTINGGAYDAPTGDAGKFVVDVTAGKAYIAGFENELLASKALTSYKGRTDGSSGTPDHVKSGGSTSLVPLFGQYLYVNDLRNLPAFSTREVITLWDATPRRKLTASAGAGTFVVGETVFVGSPFASSTARGVVVAVTGTAATSVITYYPIVTQTGALVEFAGGVQTVTGNTSGATITTGVLTFGDTATLTSVGTARAVAIDYQESNTTDQNALYRLFVSEVTLTGANSLTSVGAITFTGGQATVLHKVTAPVSGVDFGLGEIVTGNSSRAAQVGKWIRSTSSLYVYRSNKLVAIPTAGDRITGAYTTATGVISGISSAGNYTGNSSIIKLPYTSAYRVRTSSNTVDMTYKAFKELTITTNGSGVGSASVTGMTIDPKEAGNMIITSATGLQALSIATVATDGLSVSVAGAPISTTLKLIVAVTKTSVSNRTKTYAASFVDPTTTPASSITLAKADIYRIVSIVSSIDGNVTDRYTFDNGQRDYAYTRGILTLKGTLPTGTLTITYDYFNHSGSGDYFSVDSYESSGIASYYDVVPTYTSATDGVSYDLRNCLDFRPRIGDDGLYTSGSAATIDLIQPESRLTTSVQYYVPRRDIVTMNKSGTIAMITGIPNDVPVAPKTPDESILLGTVFVPAYTKSIVDVIVTKAQNQGYTMAEVAALENRLYTLEQYTLLTQTESNLVNNDIIDASTGLSRFKSGYLVDTFDNPDIIADSFSTEFNCTYVEGSFLTAKIERNSVLLDQYSNTGSAIGGAVLLPYTQVEFAKQNLSTQVTNVNPFAVYSWTGSMSLIPSSDNWVEQEYLPTVFGTATETIAIRRPWNWFGDTRLPPAGDGGCFTLETLVDMVDGSKKRIIDVMIGDQVWNWNKTEANTVIFLENRTDDIAGGLYTHTKRLRPWATLNHPIYVNQELCAPEPGIVHAAHPWLGKIEKLKNATTCAPRGETVYNLWTSGDGTYRVNDKGTTSIIGDGGIIGNCFSSCIYTKEETQEIFDFFTNHGRNRLVGAYLLNKFFGDFKHTTINKIMGAVLKTKLGRNSIAACASVLGSIYKRK